MTRSRSLARRRALRAWVARISMAAAVALAACAAPTGNEPTASAGSDPATTTVDVADTVYSNGAILTMEGDAPAYVEAVAVKDGRIIHAGDLAGAESLAGDTTRRVDLAGKAMLPGFMDAHGHVWNSGFQALSANLLPPPDGEGSDIPSLVRHAKAWAADNERAIGKAGWIVGFGYDDAQLKEQRHPTADDLDAISTELPVIFIHQSGHLGAMNHKALEMAGITADSENPPGGVIRREDGSSEPNGVLEEMAMFRPLFSIMGKFDQEANEAVAKAGLAAYARQGFTTAQEGRATQAASETWRALAGRGELIMDVDIYPDVQAEEAYMEGIGQAMPGYENGFRIAGVKLSLDGSPQGRTAWLTEPYKVPPEGQPADYRGYPAIPDESEVDRLVALAYERNWPLLAHCNGDAASDQYISAIRKAVGKFGAGDRRTVMIHAQTVREDQLDTMKELGVRPSFFSMHTYYWGDWHRDVTLGEPRADHISPTQSALKRGMMFTEHHDAPVALPSALMIVDTTVNRTSRSGAVIGADQRLGVYDALRTVTIWVAHQDFQEAHKGSIAEGKLADFVILDQDPMKVPPETLRNLQVIQTIKADAPIYTTDGAGV